MRMMGCEGTGQVELGGGDGGEAVGGRGPRVQ